MMTFFSSNLFWSQGLYILYAILLCGTVGLIFFRPLFYLSLAVLALSLYFFRNPERVCAPALHDSSVLICPADGTVVDIQYLTDSPYAQKVSIFLSPVDVHVNWIPMSGSIEDVVYRAGTFSMACLPKSSELNERNDLIVRNDTGKTIMVRQIAGAIARRICCWVHKGDTVHAGQKYGMIRFGSRVDIVLPHDVMLAIGIGQKVYGGQTVLGRWL